jgi:hypothetical protein
MRLPIIALSIIATTGCASTPDFASAHCFRYRHSGYNVLACDDGPVGRFCAKIVKTADNGKPLDYLPRACLDRRALAFGRKPSILIGIGSLGCLDHEIAHFEGRDASKYPCIGDK